MTPTFTRAVTTATALFLAGITGIATSAYAQSASQTKDPITVQTDQKEAAKPAGENKGLTKEEIIIKLKDQGYPEVSKIKRKKNKYWVKAKNTEGKTFELHVNAKTGVISRKEKEDE